MTQADRDEVRASSIIIELDQPTTSMCSLTESAALCSVRGIAHISPLAFSLGCDGAPFFPLPSLRHHPILHRHLLSSLGVTQTEVRQVGC